MPLTLEIPVYKTHLEMRSGESLLLHLIGNEGVADSADKTLSHLAGVGDNVPAGQLRRFTTALDDLRRLGELDLRINPSHAKLRITFARESSKCSCRPVESLADLPGRLL